jgi:hypothetical protein
MRRALATVAAAGLAMTAALPVLAGTASAAGSPGYLGVAAADGVRVGVIVEHFLVVSNIVDAGGPSAQALVNGFGDSTAYAAYPYPGEIVLTAHGLSQGAAPEYPLIAQSSYPTRQTAAVGQGPYAAKATSGEETSSATSSASGDGGTVVAGRTRATASTTHDPTSGAVTSEAETTLEGLSFAGVLSFGRVHSHVRVTASPGAKPVRTSDTEVGDVTVAGQQVALTDKGLVLAGSTAPLPPDSTASAALSAAGITVHYLAGYSVGSTATAPGIAVSVVQDVPGAGRTTVTYTVGQVSATARPVVPAAGDGAIPAIGSPERPQLPLQPASGGGAVLPGSVDVAPVSPPGAAPVAAPPAAAPISAPVASAPAPRTRGIGFSTGPSSVSLYAVVAVGAVVMAGAAQLFRLLAVRLAWS